MITHITTDHNVAVGTGTSTGGAHTTYRITDKDGNNLVRLDFMTLEQKGITNEILLEIIKDRLKAFQDSKFRCDNNQVALECIRTAILALNSRTTERKSRGVEGTDKL